MDAVGSRLLRRFPRNSPLVPSPLTGTLKGVRPGQTIAVALDGTIAAVSVAYRDAGGGPLRFSALAGESSFRPGRNSVRVFVVGGTPAHARLSPLRTSLSD